MLHQQDKILSQWARDNHRPGALGHILLQHLVQYPTTFSEYELFVETWPYRESFPSWYLPALVENLVDWSYDEAIVFSRFTQSPHRHYWSKLFPHAFWQMDGLDTQAALKWEAVLCHLPSDLKSAFFSCLQERAGSELVTMELERPISQKAYWERLALSLTHMRDTLSVYTSKEAFWDKVWHFLIRQIWQEGDIANIRSISFLWAQHACMDEPEKYLSQATALLEHKAINWQPQLLDLIICRMRNIEKGCSILLGYWYERGSKSSLVTQSSISSVPWHYVLPQCTAWDNDVVMDIVLGETAHHLSLQYLLLRTEHCPESIKRNIILYQCEHDLVSIETLQMVQPLKNLHHLVFLWVLYGVLTEERKYSREWIRSFQSCYECHPLYERETLMSKVPGFAALRGIFITLNISYKKAVEYIEAAAHVQRQIHAEVKSEQLSQLLQNEN